MKPQDFAFAEGISEIDVHPPADHAWEAAHDEQLAAECPVWVAEGHPHPSDLVLQQLHDREAEVDYEIWRAEQTLKKHGAYMAREENADLCAEIDRLLAIRAQVRRKNPETPRPTWRVSQVLRDGGLVLHSQDLRGKRAKAERFADVVREALADNRYEITVTLVDDGEG